MELVSLVAVIFHLAVSIPHEPPAGFDMEVGSLAICRSMMDEVFASPMPESAEIECGCTYRSLQIMVARPLPPLGKAPPKGEPRRKKR